MEYKIMRIALKVVFLVILIMGCYLFLTERLVVGSVTLATLCLAIGFSPVGRWNKIWPMNVRKIFNPAKETRCPPGHSICPECGKIEKIGEETGCH